MSPSHRDSGWKLLRGMKSRDNEQTIPSKSPLELRNSDETFTFVFEESSNWDLLDL